jgi:radical SAM/Cys-rich protein
LNGGKFATGEWETFNQKLKSCNEFPLKPSGIEIFQMNIGYMCNQTCKHCHVDAGPDRKEIMTKETMEECLTLIAKYKFPTIDLTGGAPEMNPNFRWFVEEAFRIGVKEIIVRCNLTIILANQKYNDLPEFFKKHKVRVVSSLPFYNPDKTDRQRGEGVFEKSIKALRMLNEVGYGKKDSGLILDLVYNPSGAFMPGAQESLEAEFKKVLKSEFDIDFNYLFTITNMPISRFLDYLDQSGNYDGYMEKLVNSFNPLEIGSTIGSERSVVGMLWSGVATVFSGRRTFRPASRNPSKAWALVTSCTSCRSMYKIACFPSSQWTMWLSQILSNSVRA